MVNLTYAPKWGVIFLYGVLNYGNEDGKSQDHVRVHGVQA